MFVGNIFINTSAGCRTVSIKTFIEHNEIFIERLKLINFKLYFILYGIIYIVQLGKMLLVDIINSSLLLKISLILGSIIDMVRTIR